MLLERLTILMSQLDEAELVVRGGLRFDLRANELGTCDLRRIARLVERVGINQTNRSVRWVGEHSAMKGVEGLGHKRTCTRQESGTGTKF